MYVSSTDIKCKSYTREMGLRVPSKVKVPLRMAGRFACFMDTWKVCLLHGHLEGLLASWTPGRFACFMDTWKVCLLHGHLEGVNKGHLGIGCHTRVPNTFSDGKQ